ncbi:MAG: MTH938/NDUFAF3 family protein [Candidatus Thermoplasmatota archaeon]|nr:MTH938/NDUFAF3 family protein [Candidatus Thermoplasmatota archaeon]
MEFRHVSFGTIEIDGKVYYKDIVIDKGHVRKRKKKPSKKYKKDYGHTPLTIDEDIPWDCDVLVIGTGYDGAMPVMKEVYEEADRRGVEIRVMNTGEAIEELKSKGKNANSVLHLTC